MLQFFYLTLFVLYLFVHILQTGKTIIDPDNIAKMIHRLIFPSLEYDH